ncbi:MAG: flavodoxin domain-containing protein [Micrococcales bacterium]|nr:flavodoxin domain-containing protein [Micrococcales bacterium]
MKILMSVSSRHGGTAEIGTRVAQGLRDSSCAVEVIPPDDVTQVDQYDGVVIGTSVYVGRVGLDLKNLVERQGAALRGRPVWMFWSGPVGDQPERVAVPEDVVDVAHAAGARQVHVFGGRVARELLTVTEKSLLARVAFEPGDHRDLDAAYAWGQRVAQEMGTSPGWAPTGG